jgi:hypothetical protein
MKIAFVLCLYFIIFFAPTILVLVWLEGKSVVERLDNIRQIPPSELFINHIAIRDFVASFRGGNSHQRRLLRRQYERGAKLSKA